MRKRGTSVWRTIVALVAASLFAMQALLASAAPGAEFAPPRDALGGIICISHADEGGPSDDGGSHKLPACCAQGCNIFVAGLLSRLPVVSLGRRLETRYEGITGDSVAGPFRRPETHPESPRAPPRLA